MARVRQRRNLGPGAGKHHEGRESGQLLNNLSMFLCKSLIQETRSRASCNPPALNCCAQRKWRHSDRGDRTEREPRARCAWQVKVWQL
jgi:hypothetical protein